MPGFVNPDETESRQNLYRDLLSHLNTTIWGSPSTLPRSESGKYTLDMNPVEAFDKSKNPEGAIFAEPQLNWIESAINTKGPGWQSRTLDWLAGRLGKAPKQATVESWIAKAKGAGLPTEERNTFERMLSESNYGPKDRVGAETLGFMAEKKGLPTQGIETKELSELASYRNTKKHIALQRGESTLSNRIVNILLDKRTEDVPIEKLQNVRDTLHSRARSIYNEDFTPKWSQYNLEEVTSPREILYKQRGSTYKNSDIEAHYGDLGGGLQWHQREGKLKFPEGESTHLSEQQSDLMSEYIKGVSKHKELLSGDPKIAFEDSVFSSPKPTLHENWYKTGFRDLVNRAVKEDSKFVSWDSAAVQKKRWPAGGGTDKFFDQHYDQKLVNFVKKEYGVTPEKIELGKPRGIKDYQTGKAIPKNELKIVEGVAGDSRNYQIVNKNESEVFNVFNSREQAENFIEYMYKNIDPKDSKEVWRIPVTDEMKRKVLLEGQYFSKKDEDNTFRRPYEIG